MASLTLVMAVSKPVLIRTQSSNPECSRDERSEIRVPHIARGASNARQPLMRATGDVQIGMRTVADIYSRLEHQSLGRPLQLEERALADALERIFRTGQQDFEEVARALERDRVKRPSGEGGAWTAAVLEAELARINAS